MPVPTEADDRSNAPYVENVMFRKGRVLFATVNITGSNNDGVSWGAPLPADAASYPSQAAEYLRLTVDPSAPASARFSWERVPFQQ